MSNFGLFPDGYHGHTCSSEPRFALLVVRCHRSDLCGRSWHVRQTVLQRHLYGPTVPSSLRKCAFQSRHQGRRQCTPMSHGCHVHHCSSHWRITGISFAQVGRLCGSQDARTGGGKPRPYGGYGDSHSVHQCGWNAGERVRHAMCEVLCRGGVYPLPPRSSGTHHLSEGDTRVV